MGASLDGKYQLWASFPVHLVSLWLDGDIKWQALCAKFGHHISVWRCCRWAVLGHGHSDNY